MNKLRRLWPAAALVLCACMSAHAESWTTYRIPETGTTVDIPTSIFTEDAGVHELTHGEPRLIRDGGQCPQNRSEATAYHGTPNGSHESIEHRPT